MGKKRKKKGKVDVTDSAPATHNPFASALAGLSAPKADPEDLPVADAEPKPASTGLPMVNTRVERKGRGGKTVTLVSGLESLGEDRREDVAQRLRKALGTGVSTEDGVLVVQGDQRERVDRWFDAERGE